MKRNNIIYLIFILSLGIVACEDMLEPKYDNTLGSEQVWDDPDFAQGVLMKAYKGLPNFYDTYGGQILDVATDNAVTNHFGSALYSVVSGGYMANSYPIGSWDSDYSNINYVNIFLENGLDAPYSLVSETKRQEISDRLYGEAHFLRAYYHFKLLQAYAGPDEAGNMLGIPIVTEVVEGEDLFMPRADFQSCVEEIIGDCDTAAAHLPAEYVAGESEWFSDIQIGRATSIAALALKSKVLLYAASPAYNTTDDIEKWEKAAVAAHDVIEVIGNSLPDIDYQNLRTFYNEPNHEDIIMRNYGENRGPENSNFPPSMWGQGQTNPSQELADAFLTANGYPIDHPLAEFDPDNPYKDRDPRFYATILFNDIDFKENQIQTYEGAKDARGISSNSTRTGYYLRKWLSPAVDLNPQNQNNDKHYFALFRKTEIFLNFAEASNEAWGPQIAGPGMSMTAEDAMSAIWDRIPFSSDLYLMIAAITGKDSFRDFIHNERRLELAFENHRFFDLRRWMVPLEELNQTIHGVKIEKTQDGSFTYSNYEVENRNYKDFMYYGPIPYDELIKNDQLVQNAGW